MVSAEKGGLKRMKRKHRSQRKTHLCLRWGRRNLSASAYYGFQDGYNPPKSLEDRVKDWPEPMKAYLRKALHLEVSP